MGIGKIPLSVYKSNKILDDAKFLTMNILRIRGTRITVTMFASANTPPLGDDL